MSDSPFTLSGKQILITGASSGIGRQTAITSSLMGARLILLGRDESKLRDTLKHCHQPEDHTCFSIDLREEGFDKQVKSHLGESKIDGLVHSAGVSPTLPLRSLNDQRIRETLQVNVNAGLQLAKLLTKKAHLPESGQSLVFIASVMAMVGEPGRVLYGLTKGGLVAAAKSMAMELAPKNIRVNTISPGVVETPMSQESQYRNDEKALQQIKSAHPLGLGEPEDVANACLYLLSDASKWVTGTNLVVDGGYTAK